MQLKIEYVPLEEIKPYAGNAKEHPAEQIEQIKNSIKEFGFDDPIAIWNGEIVEGHGRFIAANELGIDTVPIIRLDHLTDEQRRAYSIAHNKLTMNSGFNLDLLRLELDAMELDMSDFGFTEAEILELTIDDEPESEQEVPFVPTEAEAVGGVTDGSYDYTANPVQATGTPASIPVTKGELDLYEKNAESLVTKRVILVYSTDEEEQYLRTILKVEEGNPLNVVYNVANILRSGDE